LQQKFYSFTENRNSYDKRHSKQFHRIAEKIGPNAHQLGGRTQRIASN
jgi:hypothetical protein